MTDAVQISTTTAERSDAQRIATALVAQRLAACVQVRGPIESTYRWKDQVDTSVEWMCTIKTQAELFEQVADAIRQLHPYEEPEIIKFAIDDASDGYRNWVIDQTT